MKLPCHNKTSQFQLLQMFVIRKRQIKYSNEENEEIFTKKKEKKQQGYTINILAFVKGDQATT